MLIKMIVFLKIFKQVLFFGQVSTGNQLPTSALSFFRLAYTFPYTFGKLGLKKIEHKAVPYTSVGIVII